MRIPNSLGVDTLKRIRVIGVTVAAVFNANAIASRLDCLLICQTHVRAHVHRQLFCAGITQLRHRCITPLWSHRVGSPLDWLLLGRVHCSCACRRSRVWYRLTSSYITCYAINRRRHRHRGTAVWTRIVTFRSVAWAILPHAIAALPCIMNEIRFTLCSLCLPRE